MKNILNKSQLEQCLKEVTKNNRVKLPRDIDFELVEGKLKVIVLKPTLNMQTDSAAFEGWTIALKALLADQISEVELDFIEPRHDDESFNGSIKGHYKRFLYRVHFMTELYQDWFHVADSKRKAVHDFMFWLRGNKNVLNHSIKERKSVIQSEKMERQIESWFAFEQGKALICDRWNIDEEKIFNQLPVGVFQDKVHVKNAIFTRGASAIDLWGIGNDGSTLHIIELKCGKNIGMGVISETLFYTSVMYDSFIRMDHLFKLDLTSSKSVPRDIIQINNKGEKYNKLSVHVLAEKFHPMFRKIVLDQLNEGLSKFGITLDRATYNYSEMCLLSDE